MAEASTPAVTPADLWAPTQLGEQIRAWLGEDSVWAFLLNAGLGILALVAFSSLSAMFLVWMERKVSGHIQLRLGPMRAGPHGILQTLADGIKLLFKREFKPKMADAFTFYLAPFVPMSAAFLILAVMPFSQSLQIADPELGIIYVTALSGLGVLALLIGSWGSNNKYALLGGLRAGAQAISYEISLLLVMLTVVLLCGETSLQAIVASQGDKQQVGEQWVVVSSGFWDWWVIKAPGVGLLAFIVFFITSTAELNRAPFDLAEAESELTAGFHTEYSGIAFAMFFLAEYVSMFIAAALGATLFLGGYLAPLPALDFIPGPVWLLLKSFVIIFLFMWVRWTFPRLRIDQLMDLEWKFLMPVSLVNLLLAGALVSLGWLL